MRQNAFASKVWREFFETLRTPNLTNLRMDPFERTEQDNSMDYQSRYVEHMFAIAPASASVGRWLQSFKEFPQS